MPHLSHNQILERFDEVCQSREENGYQVPDNIRLQYLFFVANVASKSNIRKDPKFLFSCMIELVNQSQKFLKFNKSLLQRAMAKSKNSGGKAIDEKKYLFVTENALIELMDLCEPLDDPEVDLLIEKTEYTRFNHLRVKLLEKKEDYVQCCQLYVDGLQMSEYCTSRDSVLRVFRWIENIMDLLAARKCVANPESTYREDSFRKAILHNFKGLVSVNAKLTFDLIDDKFDNEHEKFILSIEDFANEQFKYLETMLNARHQMIQNCIEEYLMSGAEKDRAKAYMRLQNKHLRLLCQLQPKKVLDHVRRIKKN